MRNRKAMIGIGAIVGVVILWFALSRWFGIIPVSRFPTPGAFWDALKQIELRGYAGSRLHAHALHSLRLIVISFLVAVGTGVPLGLLMGWNRKAEALINPVFMLIRPIPPLAWIPLAILWLGLGDAAKVMVIWFAAFVPSVINAHAGVRNIDRSVIEAARMLGTPPLRLVMEVIVPAAMPMIFTGLRLSLQASWTTLVAAELVGALVGIGFVLNVAQQDIFPAMILVGMITVGILGWLTTFILGLVEKRVLSWSTAGRS